MKRLLIILMLIAVNFAGSGLPWNPQEVNYYTNATSLNGPYSVTASGNYVYVASSSGSLTTFNIANPATPVQTAYYTNATSLAGAFSVTASGNYLYVVSMSRNSLTTFNITSPANPIQIAYYTNATSMSSPRSVTTSGSYLYVASVGSDSLTTFNITNPANPVQTAYYTNATSLVSAVSVTASGNYLYVASYNGNSLTTFSITNPSTPVQTAYYTNATSLAGAASVTASGNYLYVASYSGDSLTTFNITNPAVPIQTAHYTNATSLDYAWSATTSGNYLYVASLTGNSLTTFNITSPSTPVQVAYYTNATSLYGAVSVTTSGNYLYVASQDGNSLTTFDISPLVPTPTLSFQGDLDLNNDGYLDLVISSYDTLNSTIYWGSASGLSASNISGIPSNISYTNTVADLNDDGYLDIVSSDTGGDVSIIYWGSPIGFRASNKTSLIVSGSIGNSIADLNNDGYLDILFSNNTGAYIYWGSASGFTGNNTGLVTGLRNYATYISDLNNDGRPDLLLSNYNSNKFSIFWNTPSGFNMGNKTEITVSKTLANAIADLNGDGYPDIVAVTDAASGNSYVYWNSPSGFSSSNYTAFPTNTAQAALAADLNKDGRIDLMFANYAGTTSPIYWNSATGFNTSNKTDLSTVSSAISASAEDLNNDGYVDIVTTGYLANQYVHWNSASGFSSSNRTTLLSGKGEGVSIAVGKIRGANTAFGSTLGATLVPDYATNKTDLVNFTDLDVYFRHVNGDSAYNITAQGNNSNAQVIIDQNTHKLSIIPKANWAGRVDNVRFAASDGTNTAYSNNFSIIILGTNTAPPEISFVSPSPQNGSTVYNTSVIINVSISEPSLKMFKFNWNNTNYSIYDDSLVLAMNFDNNSAIGDSSTKAVDVSKYGNNGTIYGAVWTTAGKWNGAMNFNGVSNYVSAGAISSGPSGTMMAWIKPSGTYGGAQAIMGTITSGGASVTTRYVITATGDCANGEWASILGNGATYQIACSGQRYNSTHFPAGAWAQLAVTYNGSQVKFYKDGLLINNISQNVSGAGDSQPFSIGRFGAYAGYYYSGSIDEVRIWNRTLSADEVKQQYSSNIRKQAASSWLFESNQSNLSLGSFTYYAWANNTYGASSTETRELSTGTLADTTPPSVVLSSPASGNKTPITTVTFTCSALDNIALSNATLYLWNASGSQIYSNTTPLSGTSNSTSWAYTFANRGQYSWNCLAYDNSSNSAWATSNATITIQKYAKLQIIVPANGSGISRGQDNSEDMYFMVPNNMTIIAQVVDNESGEGISGANCGLLINGAAKWTATTNSTGFCAFSYNKSGDSFGAYNLTINYSGFSTDYAGASGQESSTYQLQNWSMAIDIENYRQNGGSYYYADDIAVVNVTVWRDGAKANISNLSIVMTNQGDQPLKSLSFADFTQVDTGVYKAQTAVPSGTWIRWRGTAIYDFAGQSQNATSNLHTDIEIRASPTAVLNFSVMGSDSQPFANAQITIYRQGPMKSEAIFNQTLGSGTQSVQKSIIQNDSNYDLEIKTPDSNSIRISNFNLSAGLNFATQQANFTGTKPNSTRLMSAVLASNATSFSTSTLTFMKTFEPTSICSCQDWNFSSSSCGGAWACNSTSAYSYASNSTHFWFNVTHFTGYAIGQSENENLTIWDETDSGMQFGNQIRYINQNIRFLANYSNSSSQPITGADCRIWFTDSGWNSMVWNSTNLYEYTRSFNSGGSFDWNVTCNKTGQATLAANDTVLVNSTIAVVLNSPADGAIVKSSTVAFNWTPYGFPGDPSCNLTRNGSLVHISSCTNNEPCTFANTTANGYYVWNITCNSGATTRESSTRALTVNTLYHSTAVEGTLNMNITEISSISLPQSTISFGTVEITQTYDSYPGQFFVIKNDGNTVVDIEVNATNPFLSTNCSSLPCSAYQVKVGANETTPYPICSANPSKETYANMYGFSSGLLINDFNFVDSDDAANIYIKFRLPNDEPPGSKSSTVTFWAKSSGSYACE